MAERIAGVAFLIVDYRQYYLRGNFVVSPSVLERNTMSSQRGVTGYQEIPRVPYIEGDISLPPQISLDALEQQVGITVIARLANGRQYSLHNALCKSALDINTREGTVRVRWDGAWCEEDTWTRQPRRPRPISPSPATTEV